VDGIQPEKGNETVSLVRDALPGRVLCAENVIASETAVMKALLAPVVALDVNVLGMMSDARESERKAVEEVWPEVPHQGCPFPVRRGHTGQNGHGQTAAAHRTSGAQADQEAALNPDGWQPFPDATVESAPACDDVEASLQPLGRSGLREARWPPRNGHACRPSWPNGPPGVSRRHRSNAGRAGWWRSNRCGVDVWLSQGRW
jgi:hypothetical protein